MLDEMIEIAARHGIRLPASLAMTGKAFGQMQLAVAELDPELDPFAAVAAVHVQAAARRLCAARSTRSGRSTRAQKLKLRATRLIEGIERLTGARPGPGPPDRAARDEDARGRDPPCRPPDRARLRGRRGAARRRARRRGGLDRHAGCRSRSASPPASPDLRSSLDLVSGARLRRSRARSRRLEHDREPASSARRGRRARSGGRRRGAGARVALVSPVAAGVESPRVPESLSQLPARPPGPRRLLC